MLFVDSDNAMGSPSGDVDDAYALAALILSGQSIAAISSCAGNTSEEKAFANNRELASQLGWNGTLLRASEARAAVKDFPGRIVALGPVTNIAEAMKASEVIIVGGNSISNGRWPPFWPYEFNLTKDCSATRALFDSQVPLTIFPLNVARLLTVTAEEIAALPAAVGDYLARNSERWFRHLRRARLTRHFPVYDLAAALYVIEDRGFLWSDTTAEMNRFTAFRFGRGTRKVKLCTGLDRDLLWERFCALLRFDGATSGVSS